MQKVIEDFAKELLGKIYMVDAPTADSCWNMIERVVRFCLDKHTGRCAHEDVHRVKRIILDRMLQDARNPRHIEQAESCSVQTCMVVMARECALAYVRHAHYAQSTLAEIFKCMDVDVTGAEDHLAGLDQLFSPSQKCVLRLIYGEGCSVPQAAGMLGVSSREVRTLQWQAMELLQHEWLTLKRGGAC